MAKARYRTFCAIGYPESLSEDWLQKLEESHIPILISPLHNQDLDDKGNLKKEHYHLMIDYAGPHAPEDAEELFNSIGAVMERDSHGKLAHVADKRGMARYFCHLDEREKIKYDLSDVTELNGFDYLTLINLPSDKYSAIAEMIDFIQKYNIVSFAQMMIYARNNNDTWYRSLCDNSAFVIREFIKSYFWEIRNNNDKNITSQNLSLAKNTETQ